MYNTRFMSRMFSATEEGDEELTGQVAKDIEDAKENGVVDTDEVRYEDEGDGRVSITDKGNGEVTVAEQGEDGNYDLYPASTAELEGYIHPGLDGVTPGQMYGGVDENVDAHMDGRSVIAPNLEDGGLNFEAGHERSVEDLVDEREFSVSTDNYVVQKIFSDQAFCERIFAEVIESEDTAKVGDLKVEKDPDDDNAVIVTSESTGDQAKVVLDDDEMEVTELDTKELSYYDEDLEDLYRYYSDLCEDGEECDGECEEDYDDEEGNNFNDDDIDDSQQFDQLHVVGVDPENHVLVDAPEYDEESAQELVEDLTERGVAGVQVFDDEDEARDYAMDLMANLGAETEDDIEEPEQAEFSDHTVYLTKFYSNHTDFMTKLFSDTAEGDLDTQKDVERAIEKGEEIETDDEIITPVDDETAVIEDKNTGEFTKAVMDDDTLDLNPISEDEAEDLKEDIVTEDDLAEAEEKEYSDYYEPEIYSDEFGEKFFSEDEAMSDYMIRLFSGDADGDENDIQDAIESGEQIETDDEIITPVDDETAIVEDKESGEFTKAVSDGEKLDLTPISEDEAEDLTEDLEVEDNDDDEDEDDDEEEREYSIYDEYEDALVRLYSGVADEDDIELIEAVRMYSADDDDYEYEIESYPYRSELGYGYDSTGDPVMDRFFAEVTQPGMMQNPQAQMQMAQQGGGMAPQQAAQWAPGPNGGQIQVDAQGNPVEFDEQGNPIEYDENGNPMNAPVEQGPSLETIEDKAVAAVQSIQAAAAEAEATIMNAKAAPAQQAEPDLQEAQFSYYDYDEDLEDRYFTDVDYEEVDEPEDTLVSWLNNSTQNYR